MARGPNPHAAPRARALARARAREGASHRRTKIHRDFVKYHPGGEITEVLCRMCGGVIKSLIPVPTREKSQVINGRIVIRERLILAETQDYREIIVKFDDGSGNVEHVCAPCLRKLTVPDLEDIYAATLEQWRTDEKRGQGAAPWDILADRTPVSFEEAVR
jgi:hypothetical protein